MEIYVKKMKKNVIKEGIDIENYQDFIDAGFKECKECGWAFAPVEYDKHDCDEMIRQTKEGGSKLPEAKKT